MLVGQKISAIELAKNGWVWIDTYGFHWRIYIKYQEEEEDGHLRLVWDVPTETIKVIYKSEEKNDSNNKMG